MCARSAHQWCFARHAGQNDDAHHTGALRGSSLAEFLSGLHVCIFLFISFWLVPICLVTVLLAKYLKDGFSFDDCQYLKYRKSVGSKAII